MKKVRDIIIIAASTFTAYMIGSFIFIACIMTITWGKQVTLQLIIQAWLSGLIIAGIIVFVGLIVSFISNE